MTDGKTDGQTDIGRLQGPRLRIASHGKKEKPTKTDKKLSYRRQTGRRV